MQRSEPIAEGATRPRSSAAGFPLVLLGRQATESIPADSAGVLLGSLRDGVITIEEVRQLPSAQDSGPAFRHAVRRSVLGLMGQPGGLSVVGFYRCQAGDVSTVAEDAELFERFFANSDAVFLLANSRPARRGVTLFLWRNGELQPAAEPFLPSPAPEKMDPPAVRDRPARRRRSVIVVAVLGVIALAAATDSLLHTISLHPPNPSRSAPQPVARPQGMPAGPTVVPPAVVQPAAVQQPDPALASTQTAVRALLERWAAAQQRGQTAAVLKCYAPHLESYFDTEHATRVDVRHRGLRLLGRYGRPKMARLVDLRVTPAGPNRALATFHLHWERVGGGRTYSGDDLERMQLARTDGDWRIVSED